MCTVSWANRATRFHASPSSVHTKGRTFSPAQRREYPSGPVLQQKMHQARGLQYVHQCAYRTLTQPAVHTHTVPNTHTRTRMHFSLPSPAHMQPMLNKCLLHQSNKHVFTSKFRCPCTQVSCRRPNQRGLQGRSPRRIFWVSPSGFAPAGGRKHKHAVSLILYSGIAE